MYRHTATLECAVYFKSPSTHVSKANFTLNNKDNLNLFSENCISLGQGLLILQWMLMFYTVL